MKTRLLAFAFFSSLFISGLLGSCTKANLKDNDLSMVDSNSIDSNSTDTTSNDTSGIDTTGIGTFPKTWLDGTWRMVKEIEMPDHASDTIIRIKGCEFSWLVTFNRGGYSTKYDPAAVGCPVDKDVRYRYTVSADSNKVYLFRLGTGKDAGGWTFTSHTDSTFFLSDRGGNVWSDRFYEKQK